MPLSLHAAFVPSALQMLGTAHHLIDKAEAWCGEQGGEPGAIIGACLHEKMLPFAYQIKSVADHTGGAIDGLREGLFSPHMDAPPQDFAGLRTRLDQAIATMEAVTEEELEAKIGAPMTFQMRDFRMPFTAENFLLSFSQPNFYFHTATAYDILRMKGLDVGKRDFLGRMRLAS
ncbi:hypothetical protein GCM10011515_20330 [Tsuneonella deserti]|uniref:DUF1993 domain-containing protein n=1 Tax=Tsuneonella deserti TaxID=2035528 RepID=A0ABQ1SC15_9SPHN|nr:DUF1993 domain-containing protein [Tsuneonella deserti]GGE00451.1 hypothetical protein GCM10011515_20330 [Tsuneonella deserti]